MPNKMMDVSIKYLEQYMDFDNDYEYYLWAINNHCTKYHLAPIVCAWYENLEDFFSDWCAIGYTRTEARKILHCGKGEFQTFKNGNIIRYSI